MASAQERSRTPEQQEKTAERDQKLDKSATLKCRRYITGKIIAPLEMSCLTDCRHQTFAFIARKRRTSLLILSRSLSLALQMETEIFWCWRRNHDILGSTRPLLKCKSVDVIMRTATRYDANHIQTPRCRRSYDYCYVGEFKRICAHISHKRRTGIKRRESWNT